ncbi:MAG: thioredoxin family protein [Deltaproteobacteria bacterium]|nr:thioredoxin family protein [Deltaproteobacteria bacterium]MBN2672870.1 thioredoxin family protein [Deltaproteobacteria bacterium]
MIRACLCYYSHERCNVCRVLKPKVAQFIRETFPMVALFYVDVEQFPELAAQAQVFTVPTIKVFFEGRESFQKSRNVSMNDLAAAITRPYCLLFE